MVDGACGNRQQDAEAGYDGATTNGSGVVKLVTMALRKWVRDGEIGRAAWGASETRAARCKPKSSRRSNEPKPRRQEGQVQKWDKDS